MQLIGGHWECRRGRRHEVVVVVIHAFLFLLVFLFATSLARILVFGSEIARLLIR
jgi:hypothetical protein